MSNDCQVNVYTTRDRNNSTPLQFHSGSEHEQGFTPPNSPPANGGNNRDQLSPMERSRKSSPKAKRSRKLSLFSQFHFSTKSSDEKHSGKTRRISSPTSSPSVVSDKIEPDFDSCSSTSSVVSQASFQSLPTVLQGRCLEGSSPCPSRKTSTQSQCALTGIEKENAQIRDIITETLKMQFENVTEYKREVCDKLSKNVCQWVKRQIEIMKEGTGQACKIVSVSYVGAVRDDGIEFVSQAMLDMERDNFTAGCYRNGHIFAMAGVLVIVLDT